MTGPEVLDVARDAIITLVLVSAPLMLVGLIVGVVISLFQALTQIQEMTLVFVPKILAIFVAMLIALPFMGDLLQGHMTRARDAHHGWRASRARPRERAACSIDVSFLPAYGAAFILMFARIGTMLMLLPGLGEMSVPVAHPADHRAAADAGAVSAAPRRLRDRSARARPGASSRSARNC